MSESGSAKKKRKTRQLPCYTVALLVEIRHGEGRKQREHREAARHAESMRTHRASVAAEVARLEQTQDELLDRLLAETRS